MWRSSREIKEKTNEKEEYGNASRVALKYLVVEK